MNKRQNMNRIRTIIVIFLISLLSVTGVLSIPLKVSAANNPFNKYLSNGKVNCTWYAWQAAYDRMGVALPMLGNGGQWIDSAKKKGIPWGTTAQPNSIAVWTNSGAGHVAYVTSVDGDYMYVDEGGRGSTSTGIATNQKRRSAIGSYQFSSGDSSLVGFVYLTDTTPPSITNVYFSEQNEQYFIITYTCSDNTAIAKERLVFYCPNKSLYKDNTNVTNGTHSMKFYWADMPDGEYYVAITQWDAAGNKTTVKSATITKNTIPETPPKISNVTVSDISDSGYTVSCNVSDNGDVARVVFIVFIERTDGTVDKEEYEGTISGNTASCHINALEKNTYYHTYIIATDNVGNNTQVSPDDFPCLKVYIKEKVQEVEYRVIHYKEKLDGEYSKANDETFKAKPGTNVTPDTKSYTGFSSPSAKTVSVEADGTTIVKYYYTRNSYTLTWQLEGGTASGSYTEGTVKYGTTITAPTVEKEGYELAGWSTSVPETMPAENLTIIAKWELAGKRETEAFVTRFYKTILGRDPDKPGLDNWVNSLISGERTAADVARGFVLSQEFLNQNVSNAEFVRRMYTAFLDRSALDDQPGYDHWIDFLNAGCSREYVVAEFIKSVEFGNLCKQYKIQAGELNADNGAPTRPTSYPKLKVDSSRVNDQELTIYVARLYRVILGREASGYEIESWKETIKTGREYDAASVASAFFMSTEYMSKHKSNKDFTADCYKAFFDRDPRGTPEKIYYDDWVRKLDVGEISRTQMIEYGFGQSQEFKNLLTSFGFRIIE